MHQPPLATHQWKEIPIGRGNFPRPGGSRVVRAPDARHNYFAGERFTDLMVDFKAERITERIMDFIADAPFLLWITLLRISFSFLSSNPSNAARLNLMSAFELI